MLVLPHTLQYTPYSPSPISLHLSMDPDYPTGKSPRRELQGPRPTPLKVRKDSHKIKKPPVAPSQPSQQQAPLHRPPVIIYTVSPKVIHTEPSEFMTLVQRLTGSSNTLSSTFPDNSSELMSPAARFASVEKTKSPKQKMIVQSSNTSSGGDVAMVEEMEISTEIERSCSFPGILSPGPAALQPIPSNFFSPPSDPNPMSFFHDLSPGLQGNKNYLENSFFLSPHVSPTTPSLDLFNNFFDL